MFKSYAWLPMAIAVALASTVAVAQEDAAKGAATTSTTAPRAVGETIVVHATVINVDQSTRFVTLKGKDGKEVTVEAGDDVRNLDQLKAGDTVTLKYHRALALDILPAGSVKPDAVVEGGASRAEPGQKPGGVVGQSVTITATLTAIDLQKHTVTLKGPEGNEKTIEVKDPVRQANMAKLKVGDMVRITYIEAVAVEVKGDAAKSKSKGSTSKTKSKDAQ